MFWHVALEVNTRGFCWDGTKHYKYQDLGLECQQNIANSSVLSKSVPKKTRNGCSFGVWERRKMEEAEEVEEEEDQQQQQEKNNKQPQQNNHHNHISQGRTTMSGTAG